MANAVVLILYKAKEKKILFQRRDEHAPKYPNMWALISGAIEMDESPEHALRREVQEELNYSVESTKRIDVIEHEDGTKHYFESLYNGSPLQLLEGDGIVWWPFDEALALDMPSHHKAALQRWLTDIRDR